ncbi:MAG: TonB-dependent receptor [Phycisphaerae bacterium]|nr:TonB-dependent receptor [Phycisphaerae bacterium]
MTAGKILSILVLLSGLAASARAGADGLASVDRSRAAGDEDFFAMSIEELMDVRIDTVYGASKRVQRLEEAPASATVVTADEIRKYGYRTLADILQSAPGFYANYDRMAHYVGTRGFRRPGDFDTRILVLIDGHKMNDSVSGAPPSGTEFPLDVELIDRVEIIRGPGSSLYGSNAVLAIVNVITKRGSDIDGLELNGQTGSFDAQKGRITYGKLLRKDVDLLLSASTYSSDGPSLYYRGFDTPQTSDGWVENDDEETTNVAGTLSWGDFSFDLIHAKRDKGIPVTMANTAFGDSRTRVLSEGTLAGLTWIRELSEQYTAKARFAYCQGDTDLRNALDLAPGAEDPVVAISGNAWTGRWWEAEFGLTGSPIEGHTVTVGTEFRYEYEQDQTLWLDDLILLDYSEDNRSWGIYLQDEVKLLEKLTFIGSVRHDEYETCGGTTSPRLGLIYDLCDRTTLKLLYGQAFRAPSAYSLYYENAAQGQKAANDLEPGRIRTYEAVVDQQLTRNLLASACGFHYVLEDLIDTVVDPSDGWLVFENRGEVQASGIELALRGRWTGGLQARASYSYVEAEDETTDETLVNSPKHLAKLSFIQPVVAERLFAGLEFLYESEVKTVAGDHADDFMLTNLTLTYVSVSKRLEIAASVYNLFDVDYAFPSFAGSVQDTIEQDGRTFRAGLTYRF